MKHPGNRTRQRTPAQLANLAAQHIRFGRRCKEQPEPFGRAVTAGLFSMQIKTVPAWMRALIDEAVAARC